jgi:predicted MFS family arabinose efflux permease
MRPSRSLLVFACAVAILDSIFIAALAPLLPFYTRELDIGSGEAGMLAASYSVGLLVGALPAGILGVRFGQRDTLVGALAVLAVTSVVFGLADSFAVLLVARSLEGVASAFAWTAMLGWLVALSGERHAQLFGVVFGAAFAGFTLGPALGALAAGIGPEPVFVAIGVVCALLAGWTFAFQAPRKPGVRSFSDYLRLASQPSIPYALWLQALPGILLGATSVVGSLLLDDLGASSAAIATAFLLASALQGGTSPLVGRWTDRSGTTQPLRIGLVGAAVASALMALPDEPVVVALLLAASWVAFSTVLVPATAILTAGVEQAEEDPTLGFALMNVAFAPGAIAGSTAAGALRDAFGDEAALAGVAVVCLATLLLPAPAARRAPLSKPRRA